MIIELARGVASNSGQLWLVHRRTPAVTEGELPVGKVEVARSETPVETVKREIQEELG